MPRKSSPEKTVAAAGRKGGAKAAGQTQTEKAYAAIKRAILQGEIEEGVFLSETDVMARYDIGRTPYREACNRLHHEGLLQVVPRRGYFVPEISFHSVCDLFEVRAILEDAVAQIAVLRATDQEIDELKRLAERPLPPGRSPSDFTQFVVANSEFHMCLAKTTRNRRLIELLKQNLENTERLMYIELRSRRFGDQDFHALHGPIVAALRNRDRLALRQAVWEDLAEAQGATIAFNSTRGGEIPLVMRPGILTPSASEAEQPARQRSTADSPETGESLPTPARSEPVPVE